MPTVLLWTRHCEHISSCQCANVRRWSTVQWSWDGGWVVQFVARGHEYVNEREVSAYMRAGRGHSPACTIADSPNLQQHRKQHELSRKRRVSTLVTHSAQRLRSIIPKVRRVSCPLILNLTRRECHHWAPVRARHCPRFIQADLRPRPHTSLPIRTCSVHHSLRLRCPSLITLSPWSARTSARTSRVSMRLSGGWRVVADSQMYVWR